VPLGDRIYLEGGCQRAVLFKSRYFTDIASSGAKTVARMHILAAYKNKHWQRAFGGGRQRY